MFLIDDLLLSPINGFQFILRTVQRIAEEQYTDDAPLKEQLLELQARFDAGEVSEEEYVETQAEILRALRDVQRRRMAMAGVDPDAPAQPLSGRVGEGSGVDVHLDYGPDQGKR